MKKMKIKFGLFLMVVTMFTLSVGLSQDDESIDELPSKNDCEGPVANLYCPYWDVEYEVTQGLFESTVKVTCRTGGIFYCEIPE